MKRLTKKFFTRNTIKVARELLGKFLVRQDGKRKVIALITETEAYHGPDDLASHASRGRTQRTEVMFGPAGLAYVYLIYGMYYCFNIVTGKKDFPAAVLIRGVFLLNKNRTADGLKPSANQIKLSANHLAIDGPGKVCRALKIERSLNKENLLKSKKLNVCEDKKLLRKICSRGFTIKKSTRVGVDYAEKYKNKPWRFIFVAK